MFAESAIRPPPLTQPGALSGLSTKLAGISLVVNPPGNSSGTTEAQSHELVWVIKGDLRFESGGTVHSLSPGSVVLIHPGARYTFELDAKRQSRYLRLCFEISDRNADLPSEDTWAVLRQMPDGDVLRPLLRHIAWLVEARAPGTEALAELALRYALVVYVLDAVQTKREEDTGLPEPVERALAFAHEVWNRSQFRDPTLDELAKAARISAGHLSRLFRQALGHPPLETLRLLRLDRAANELMRTNLSIKQVAEIAGFQSQFHFSRRFKEAFGDSPTKFRSQLEHGMPIPPSNVVRVRQMADRVWGTAAAAT